LTCRDQWQAHLVQTFWRKNVKVRFNPWKRPFEDPNGFCCNLNLSKIVLQETMLMHFNPKNSPTIKVGNGKKGCEPTA